MEAGREADLKQRLAQRVRSKGCGCGCSIPAHLHQHKLYSRLREPLTRISDALPEHRSPQVWDCVELHAMGQHVQCGDTA